MFKRSFSIFISSLSLLTAIIFFIFAFFRYSPQIFTALTSLSQTTNNENNFYTDEINYKWTSYSEKELQQYYSDIALFYTTYWSNKKIDLKQFKTDYNKTVFKLKSIRSANEQLQKKYAQTLSHLQDISFSENNIGIDIILSLFDKTLKPAYQNHLNGYSTFYDYFCAKKGKSEFQRTSTSINNAMNDVIRIIPDYQNVKQESEITQPAIETFLNAYIATSSYEYTYSYSSTDIPQRIIIGLHGDAYLSNIKRWCAGNGDLSVHTVNFSYNNGNGIVTQKIYVPISAFKERGCNYIYGYDYNNSYYNNSWYIVGAITDGFSAHVYKSIYSSDICLLED